jgi:hypothetical protein
MKMALTRTDWMELFKMLLISAMLLGSIFAVVYLLNLLFSVKF